MKIKRNVPLAAAEEKHKWPFGEMKVKDVVEIKNRTTWPVASKAAHNFGQSKDPCWRFTTTWLEDENVGRIRRVK